jgi:hypothetical protein
MNRTLPAALLALAPAAACSARAAEYSAHKADLVEHRMERVRSDDPLALAHAAEADEVLAYGDDDDPWVEVRITSVVEPAGFDSGGTDVRCYRYRQVAAFDVARDRIDCGERPALALPPLPPAPTLPDGIDAALATALTDLAGRGVTNEAAVRAAVTPLAGGPPVVVDVATVDGDVGVSIHVPGQCLFGRITAGTAAVWRVPDVLAQPGELGCGAGPAAAGQGTRPPH